MKILVELGWLQRENQQYYRVREFPNYPTFVSEETKPTKPDNYNQAFINVDVGAIAEIYSQPIRGIQRFFLDLDYIIFSDNQDRVDDLLHKFRYLWQQPSTPPVKLTYNSARINKSHKYIVYPVCIYYVRRAVYLCAFGETVESTGEWYNYRLDRIQNLTLLQWDNPNIPQFLFQHYQNQTLPIPDYIQEQMGAAWGFDFYSPSQLMVLRFERDFHDRYLRNTFRHHTFQLINYQQVEKLIQQNTPPAHQQHLLTVFKSRNRHDAYYRAYYRENDTNVKMRLRAWRPNVEILLPWQLRQKIAEETATEYQHYF
ncbi:MAG: TIGR03985 family CRISPR-associated protein [Microcoleaceae cyanobacterium]